MSMMPTAPAPSQLSRVFPRFLSLQQVTLLFVLALLVGVVAGGLFALIGLRPRTVTGTQVTIPSVPVAVSNGPGNVTFTTFGDSNLSIKYPNDWKKKQNGNTYSFNRSDGVTLLAIGLHDFDSPEKVVNDLTGATLSCTVQSNNEHGPKINTILWTTVVFNCYLASAVYVVTVLTYQNYPARDETQLVYAGYQSVGSPQLVNFDQANKQYFQPMLESLQLK